MSATLTQSVTDTLDKVGKLKLSGEEASQSTPTGQEEKRRAEASGYKYAHLLPEWHTSLKLPPLEPFEHVDPGHQALKDPAPRSFLEGAAVRDITPNVGTEVTDGVDLTKLDARARSQLALFVAQRGVVVFKNQQAFIDSDPRWQIDDWGSFFGRIHIHPVSGYAKEFPEFHLVWREESGTSDERTYEGRINNLTVHSDVTYELQPPGLTTLFLYDSPPTGGDTLFISQTEAYKRLSPSFQSYLETLEVEHSGVEQYERAVKLHGADTVKRQPVKHIHPLVRRHPVTGEKALFVNRGFSRRIIGLKQEESDAILGLLYDHLERGHDFSARARWGEKGTVVLWDNRVTAHSALVDWSDGIQGRRHGARITPQAERPFL
ncbi:alpha-ketoglutarate-dependent sulfonate dioxygenase [Rhodotorula diobovata]|uniref:Alpha-ketoglutarate-dependent sulfonate dioxygenase n=1 Tax=Rhodotorula diobovata TaxID=5288 RepID=A0A5C5G181_9BASI|nr:alpha-ketoglutarate-dependent sulfonate dioxygenase [Rhodotorula diobovata]